MHNGETDLTDKYNKHAEYLVELIDKCSHDFIKCYNIDEYIINNENGTDKEILKCLAYIHLNNKEEAIKIAQNSVDNGNTGNYENEGKGFFEWVLLLT